MIQTFYNNPDAPLQMEAQLLAFAPTTVDLRCHKQTKGWQDHVVGEHCKMFQGYACYCDDSCHKYGDCCPGQQVDKMIMILVALLTAVVIKVVTLDLLIQVVCQGSSPLSGLATALFGPANWVTDLIEVILCTLIDGKCWCSSWSASSKNFLSKVKRMPLPVATLNSTGTSSVGGADVHVDDDRFNVQFLWSYLSIIVTMEWL